VAALPAPRCIHADWFTNGVNSSARISARRSTQRAGARRRRRDPAQPRVPAQPTGRRERRGGHEMPRPVADGERAAGHAFPARGHRRAREQPQERRCPWSHGASRAASRPRTRARPRKRARGARWRPAVRRELAARTT
jgi:hypothetical protein